MKKTKIVIPALAVLLLSTAASVSGTVAWFSMNTAINVTGMSVTTKVSSSLQIAETNNEEYFSNENLRQVRSGILEPASTVDGNAFFYTTDAKSNGDAREDSYVAYDESDIRNGDNPLTPSTTETNFSNALGTTDVASGDDQGASDAKATGKTSYDPKFNDAYAFTYNAAGRSGRGDGNVSFAYIDYSFYLKAFMQQNEKISLTTCNMKYNNGALQSEHAWRVAFFAHKVNLGTAETNVTTTGSSENLITILNFAESKNHNQTNKAVQKASGDDLTGLYTDAECQTAASGTAAADGVYYQKGDADPKAVASANALGNVTGHDAVNHVNNEASIVASATGSYVYKVVVRLWLEGEDITCKSDTFATLTNSWTLDLGFKLGSEAGVKLITNTVA